MSLTAEENELMCRVGPGTPMGEMLKEYWWPVLRSEKLVADAAPERVRLMARNYVAFRASDGRVGFFDEGCPHRQVSLALARNEDCALRCLMHGWKIDVDGQVVDTPNEFGFKRPERIKTHHYPVREAGGMVWVYVGDGEPSPFPKLSFNLDNGGGTLPTMAKFKCNWVQLMETLWDPAHVGILHGTGDTMTNAFEGQSPGVEDMVDAEGKKGLALGGCEAIDTDFGFMYKFAKSGFGDSDGSWIPTVMPCWLFISPPPGVPEDFDRIVFGHVPIDDENTILWQIAYNPDQPCGPMGEMLVKSADDPDDWRVPGMTYDNRWGQDREAMANGSYTGIGEGRGVTGILLQDVAMAESMYPIVDRTWENLGPADRAIIKGRRMLLDAVRAHQRGEAALGSQVDTSNVGRSGGFEDTFTNSGAPEAVSLP